MKNQIHSVAVLGAGTMGAAIAAHLANAGVGVTLLDILTGDASKGSLESRNKIVTDGLERAKKSRPASFFSSDQFSLVSVGNFEDDFQQVGKADWIIEVVIENLEIKQKLMARIDAIRKPGSIVSSNTSGIPLEEIAANCSADFKQHFLGTHFFNPPRYLKLLEIIPTNETLPKVLDVIVHFGEYRLGKGIVLCKDTPNFIGNRFAFGTGAYALHYILENDLRVEEVDAVTGPIMGRPKTATFRLIDLVGIDVWKHVGKNLVKGIPYDKYALPYLEDEKSNNLIETMLKNNWLGNKTRVGFYKEVITENGKEFWPLNLKTLEHEAPSKVRFESVSKIRDIESLSERLKILQNETDRGAQLVKNLLFQSFQYASALLPEVADTCKPIDDAVRWGFGHDIGPFELWDEMGVGEMSERMRADGFTPAPWVDEMLKNGVNTFYRDNHISQKSVYDVSRQKYVPISTPQNIVILKDQKVITKNSGATLYDIGSNVALVEFHTKMNALDDDIFNICIEALDRVEKDFEGLVIGCEADNFSAGANLFMVVVAAQQGMWDTLDEAIRKLQGLNMRMRYFPKPIVSAPTGLTLGGGAEIVMHTSRVVGYCELYIGLVEMGAGVIPAGGGTKELIRRIINPPLRTANAEFLPFLQRVFEQIGLAKVSTSAEEGRQAGFLTGSDRIVMNREHLLTEAREEVLHLAANGYRPPPPEPIFAAGRDGLAALQVGIEMMTMGKYITEYEKVIVRKLADILTGGGISRPSWVSENYILDLEREAFLSLCGNDKTQKRMWNLLQTGKVLRN